MKKYLFMFVAFMAMFLTAVSITSCGDDDDDTMASFTVSFEVTRGNLTDEEYQEAKQLEQSTSQICTQSEAKAAFDKAVSMYDAQLQTFVDNIKSVGRTGFSITAKLTNNTTDKVVMSKTWQ